MRTLASAALHGAAVTITALAALRATDPVLAVAVVAAVSVLLTWFAALSSTEDASGLDATGTLPGVALAIVGRSAWGTLLPVLAVQAVLAVAIGAAANALDDRLGPTLLLAEPTLVLAAVTGALVGITSAWVTLSIDGGGPVALSAVPALVAGGTGPLALLGAFNPALLLGLATAGLIPWDATAIALVAAVAGAVVGTYTVSALLPHDE
ncbi:hypothetical protein [Aeromicrobium sp. Leaf350]|uniref:hypothetical protein n=1 Tax=Aeromicrobium sp. Leaf350 TaxID=2876565 RepID=UPI001E29CF7E|nr:hypothetical protein [Aeromicrobium sp. Leaf350]